MKQNPFKMVGSWVGAYLTPIIVSGQFTAEMLLWPVGLVNAIIKNSSEPMHIYFLVAEMIGGFLVGWFVQNKFFKRRG